ncbi:hypothetical protein ACFFP0_28975 [Rhizobium puerariae]|uniref:Tetratricopeptide repeat protein n=1 Tax=Rhizobium puerariae TaxID=1585791 RepID=A0ABV6AQJ6_9HYPH
MQPSPAAIRQQLETLRRSASFNGSDRLMALLEYLVEETLEGRGEDLKEAVIGNAVYQRDPPYDPRIDSTVRVEVRRLRRKLDDHFALEGRSDPVSISIPVGTYSPLFAAQKPGRPTRPAEQAAPEIFRHGPGTVVAILPVRAFSREGPLREFAGGLTDELIFAFGSEPGIRIPSRATTFAYTENLPSIPALAEELGADAVLQGTVREEAGMIRVTIEISDPRGFVVSSDRFDGASGDGLGLQEKIATTLTSRLRFDSSRMRAFQISPGPDAIRSHAKIYRARQLLDRQMPATLREALAIFSDVANTAPDYARGHSGIADCCCDMFRIGIIDGEEALPRARAAADRALEIDPQSIEANTARATISAWLERDRNAAEAGFERALELGDNARTVRVYGSYLSLLGREDEAERLFREARRIEPFSQQQDIAEAVSHFQARRFDRALADMASAGPPAAAMEAVFYNALACHFGGDADSARLCAKPLGHLPASHPQLVFADAEVEAWLGAPQRAERLLDAGNAKASQFARATLACATGNAGRAFTHLAKALERRELATVWMRGDIRFDALRGTAEFSNLLAVLEALRLS